ncbi:MAG: hypothetical protein IKG01_09595 [Lachnospiraceae bacterium]|nr:hypothetical protein [Lachnospiraceae bacterium]
MISRKLSSLLLCGAMVLSIAGCSTNGTSAATAAGPAVDQDPTAASAISEVLAPVAADSPADNSDDIFVSKYPAFAVTSQSLHDGKWDEITANTVDGKNASPELSWEPIEGAYTYVIYMIDMDTAYFIHWKSADITETSLPEGWATSTDYVGPYPPPGSTHHYNVYVFALKNPVERAKGGINSICPRVPEFMEALDTDASGNTGNIIAVGRVSGAYTAK